MKVRCIDASESEGELARGVVYSVVRSNDDYHWFEELEGGWCRERFEPVSDTIPAPPPEPDKVDPYEAHRLTTPRECLVSAFMDSRASTSGATARLHAGLAAEKPVVRVKPWPKDARNPR